MYARNIKIDLNSSCFIFGPRGVGKSFWLKNQFADAVYIDLLKSEIYTDLLAKPERVINYIPQNWSNFIIIDEIQRIPNLLNEIHRLIENDHLKFILTGSSPRKLRRSQSNLLAGRALLYYFFPLTAKELGVDFNLNKALQFGMLPSIWDKSKFLDARQYLETYLEIYLREEVYQEGLTRNLEAFSRFLEAASFSQGQPLNTAAVARECSINRKVVENYFNVLSDLLLAFRLPVFSKRAKRKVISHDKFYFFDIGVYQTIRPKAIFDKPEEIEGIVLESLVIQELRALINNDQLDSKVFFWRTTEGQEVDFVIYGSCGLIAIEVKRKEKLFDSDLRSLKAFIHDYPEARAYVFYGGREKQYFGHITAIPYIEALKDLDLLIKSQIEKG